MSELMLDGFSLALYGMGFVFTFLILLVFLTVGMSAVVLRFSPPAPAVAPKRRAPKRAQNGKTAGSAKSADKAQIVAAITAAVRQHRQSD